MKSISRCNHGLWGVDSRRRLPAGSVHGTLALTQIEQDEINQFMFLSIYGHQYLPCRGWCVL